MIKASNFWRTLSVVGLLANALLFVVLFFAVRSAGQAEAMTRWVDHTQEVIGVLAQARLERLRLQLQSLTYNSTKNPQILAEFQTHLQALRGDVERLRSLTADNPTQQKLLDQLQPAALTQAGALERTMQPGLASSSPRAATRSEMIQDAALSQRITQLFDELETNERSLFVTRSAAVQANARQTRLVLVLAGILTFGMLGAGGFIIRREIQTRSQVEAGLRRAHELLGGKFQEGQAELGETLKNLHAQIGARQQAEDEIRRLNEELEQRVKQRTAELEEANRELETFSYSVSHDLRAPLRHIDSFSRILQEEGGSQLPEESLHYLDRIRSAATKMSALVEDLLHLSRIGRQLPRVEVHPLEPLVAEAQAEVLPEAGGRQIHWQIQPLGQVEGDSILLRQVFTNLFSNAVKFTRHQSYPVIEVGCLESHGETVIFVRDNGVGFDPRYADKLFGVFQRLHRQDEFEGTGIGLATVQRIVHKHGGRVWAESQVGQGAAFYFSLPAKARQERPAFKAMGAYA